MEKKTVKYHIPQHGIYMYVHIPEHTRSLSGGLLGHKIMP